MSAIIQARELSRWYGIVMGLNNVSFDIDAGLTGLVGPNGAGKSTLIQIVTGQLKPSSGRLTVFGQAPWNNPPLIQRIGFCPEGEAVPKDLRPVDWLKSLAALSGLERKAGAARCEAILDRVGLAREHWPKRMAQFSKGMKQRVKLAQGLLHDPDLLVLDEPMNGLDPMGRQEMARLLKDLVAEGVSILISSHILAELESLSRNILILNWGRILASGSQREIRTDLKDWSEELSIQCDSPERLARHLFDAGVLLGFDLDAESSLRIRVKDASAFYARWTGLLLDSGVTVYALRSQSHSLKDIFDKVTT
ncbi:MAG: ABC transporter ATP-binding protein [Limisphaerales bacterium]|jgi:ABC-2 type transport system ATP-binding protein